MQHSVYLQGELGERFGSKFVVNTNNYADIFKCINANRPDFLPYVRKCHQEDINFMVETEDGSIDQTDLIVPICKGDITISLVPAGSKSGIGKLLAAIAIIAVIYFTGRRRFKYCRYYGSNAQHKLSLSRYTAANATRSCSR